jgi:hypothetical protein
MVRLSLSLYIACPQLRTDQEESGDGRGTVVGYVRIANRLNRFRACPANRASV